MRILYAKEGHTNGDDGNSADLRLAGCWPCITDGSRPLTWRSPFPGKLLSFLGQGHFPEWMELSPLFLKVVADELLGNEVHTEGLRWAAGSPAHLQFKLPDRQKQPSCSLEIAES